MAAPTELLQKVPLFSDLDNRELSALANTFKERNFTAGDTITTEGRAGIGFFVIEDGEATVSVRGEERAGGLSAGDYFGEVALIDEGSRSATVTAKSDLRAYGLTPWEFRPLVESNAAIAWKLLQAMAKKLRSAEERAAG